MKKYAITFILSLCLMAVMTLPAQAVSLEIDNTAVSLPVKIYNNTAYIPLRAVMNILYPEAAVSWENRQAVVKKADLTLTAKPGSTYMQANGRMLYAPYGVKLVDGTTLVPARVLAKALGAAVGWDNNTRTVLLSRGTGTIEAGDTYYNADSVYWLSRIINAESESESLGGKIAVGNVILNRVKSPDFPDSIYGVIFDSRWGGQFQPAKNGTINNTPTAESVLAAKLCLDGASVAGSSLFFLNPAISTSFWMMENKSHVATVGNHQFYV